MTSFGTTLGASRLQYSPGFLLKDTTPLSKFHSLRTGVTAGGSECAQLLCRSRNIGCKADNADHLYVQLHAKLT